jgi:Helix-turn-helix domain
MRAVLDITDAAYYTRFRERQLMDLVAAGKIPYRKQGKTVIFLRRELDAWLETLPGLTHAQLKRFPASFTVPGPENARDQTSPDGTHATGVRLVKGRQQHHHAPSTGAGER